MVHVEGKGNISAKVTADSISETGQRITTFELEYPRFIHSEFMTHRQLSRNAASSRAIPISKVIEQIQTNPAMPIHWGKNQAGMQAKEEVHFTDTAKEEWLLGRDQQVNRAKVLADLGIHKQIANRRLECDQFIKVVCTATEYDNFLYLRNHEHAQPEIAELARCMQAAMDLSEPQLLKTGEWHLPYISIERRDGELLYCTSSDDEEDDYRHLSLEDAIKISASLCAQVSYRKSDESMEKALKIYDMLVTMKPVHASPFEHQAMPIAMPKLPNALYDDLASWMQEGVTHADRDGNLWSGNLKGWVQNRQLIPGHVYTGEDK